MKITIMKTKLMCCQQGNMIMGMSDRLTD